ncbi:hypothetical protein Plav_1570 [Parvibaculum lavamentivorans DS-1]|uniref:Uncharacterized protein n=1 Tax=Parvibaculum lavamentivorans (strain DS-1 / DSM 13023 / NCIMB 13966) TaxID=402881 RepID=A7HTF6_PARL1|nr:hypothetical protein [Parvibaculum lavamentivorans]ABS63189.1 hypothetical protein Plav_1570 [Parvibaculum lavamentivorans DS-1]
MSGIERIRGTQRALPGPSRRAEDAPRAKRIEPAPMAQREIASHAGLGHVPLTGTRPVAAFLAQYVDQHWPWPRSPARKAEERHQATSAYIGADMLPDLLAETLRTGHHDRKL